MRIREDINNQFIIFCFVDNTIEANIWVVYVLEIDHLTQEFVFHEFYTQIIMRIQEESN